MTSVVVGVDGSDTSWRALAMAIWLVRYQDGFVHACFVSHVPATAALAVVSPMPLVVDPEANGRDVRRLVEGELARAGIRGDVVCVEGDVASRLEELAQETRADLIVIGRSAHPHLHLGGVPRRLLAQGHHPVLVVP